MAPRRPSFVSPTGLLLAGIVTLGVLAWTLIAGSGLFSSGPLNSAAKGSALGGVTTHADLQGDCGSCHSAPWSGASMADRCVACHRDVGGQIATGDGLHGRLLSSQTSPTCRGCHPEHNGADAALTVLDGASFRHELTGFSLRTHERTAEGSTFTCSDCHARDLSFELSVCSACHLEIDVAFTRRHVDTYGSDCLPCHDGTGRDGVKYHHTAGPFALTGAHVDVPCVDCHGTPASREDLVRTPQDCYSCHAADDHHQGAFGSRCEDCHLTAGWGEVAFEHDVFPLDHGSDERTATCEMCHPSDPSAYTCYGCHAHTEANVLDKHEGWSLSELADCVRCHPGGRQADKD